MRIIKILLAVLVLMLAATFFWLLTPPAKKADSNATLESAVQYDSRIIRDNWGVAHIFGVTDPDTSFGLGYSHAEDDWATIQQVIIAARGQSAQYFGRSGAATDYLFDLFKISEAVDAKIDTDVDPAMRAMAKAYADGLNLWGSENPEEVFSGILPITDRDVFSGITWAVPFFYRMDDTLKTLFSADERPSVSPWEKEASFSANRPPVSGSNAFAVAPSRSDDGHTRLIVNSHQPFTGPYAWFEAHVVSEEGLNLAGAGFPGTPVLTQGVTPHHGWAQTVNRPDLVDVYALEVDNDKNPKRYKLDGEWVEFEKSRSMFRVKLFGPFSLPVKRPVLWSQHGPVLSTDTGHYAIRFTGLQEVGAMGQWYKMSKVQSFDEWQSVMAENHIPSFNVVYADRNGNISQYYNARMPDRIEGPEWTSVLPGDNSELIWDSYRPLSDLPQHHNPESGWLFSANATPFQVTDPEFDNVRADFSKTFGIENRMTNRALRALDLFVADASISKDELLAYRADDAYHPQSRLRAIIDELIETEFSKPELIAGQDVLRMWDGRADLENRGTALAVLTGMKARGYEIEENLMPFDQAFREAIAELKTVAGRIDPTWGEVNRLRRGDVDLSLQGGPDTLRAIYGNYTSFVENKGFVAVAGDTHIMHADWDENGKLNLETIHQFGAATLDDTSPHFADQAPLFAKGAYKPMPMTVDEVLPLATRDYRPGQP